MTRSHAKRCIRSRRRRSGSSDITMAPSSLHGHSDGQACRKPSTCRLTHRGLLDLRLADLSSPKLITPARMSMGSGMRNLGQNFGQKMLIALPVTPSISDPMPTTGFRPCPPAPSASFRFVTRLEVEPLHISKSATQSHIKDISCAQGGALLVVHSMSMPM